MSFARPIPNHLRPRRAKLFTDGKQTPIDRNDRARVMCLAEVARRKGEITRAAVDILRALLFTFANLTDGRCFPSYERLAEAAGCVPRTVGRCLPDLEAAGFGDVGKWDSAREGARGGALRHLGERLARHAHKQRLRFSLNRQANPRFCR